MPLTFTEADFAGQPSSTSSPTPTNRLAFSESDFEQASPPPVPQLNQYNPTLLERGRDLLSRVRRSDSAERILGRTPEEIAANPASPDAPTTTDAGVGGLFQSKKPVVQLYDNPTTALDGLHNWAGSVVNSLGSPGGLATAPIAAVRLPALVAKALALAFGAQGAKISYDQVKDLVENHKKNNPAQTVEDIGNLITGTLMAAGGALGLKKPKVESEQPNASSITSPTGVSGPQVRPGVAPQTPLRQQGETAGAQESADSQRAPSAQSATSGQNAGTVKPGALPKTPDPNWQVTVQAPQKMGTVAVPGYVQIDDVTGGVNRWSRSPESLAREGLRTADFSKLPSGKYTYAQAVELAKKVPEQTAEIPLGINRPTKVNPELGKLSDADFDAEYKTAKQQVWNLEGQHDQGKLDANGLRQLADAQDRWTAANLERFRRNAVNTAPSDLFRDLKDLASKAVQFGRDSEQHQKAVILMQELQRQGAKPEDMLAEIKLSSPDAAEVFKADMEDIRKIANPQKVVAQPAAPESVELAASSLPEPARTREAVLDNARQNFPFGQKAKVQPTDDLRSTDVFSALTHANVPVSEALKMTSGEIPFPSREKFESGVEAKYRNDAGDLVSRTWGHLRTLGLSKKQFAQLMPQASDFSTGKDYYDAAKAVADKAAAAGAGEMAALMKSNVSPKPASVSRRQDAFAKGKRGYDVIDHLQDNIGKIDPTLIKQADPDWKPTGAARQLFQKGGIPADVALQEAMNSGMMGNVSLDDFGHGLNDAATARTGNSATRSAEEVLAQKQDAQASRFHTDIRKPTEDTNPLLTEDLNEGDEFQLHGKKLKVTRLDYDEDGRVTFLELDDGNRYGTQTFHGDTMLRKDSGVPIKRAPKPVEAAPVADKSADLPVATAQAALPKLAPNEKGTGDLLKNQTEDLKLVGEKGTDLERIEAEKAQARADKQAAKDFEAKNQPGFVGMGAAVPSEFGHSGGGFSIKNAWMDAARAKLGLGSAVKVLRETWGQALDRAEATINRDPAAPEELVEELKRKPRSLDPWEKAMIGWYWIQNKTEFDNLSRDASQAYDDGRLDDLAERKAQLQVFGDKLLDIANVADRTGTIEGRALNARKMLIDDDFTLASLETQKRAERGGSPVTDEERKQLQKVADDYRKANEELQKHLATAKEQLGKAQADLELARLQKTKLVKPRKGAPGFEEKVANKMDSIRQKVGAGKLGDITNDVQALARLFVQMGVRDREQLIDAVHGVLTQIVPEMTRRDTMDAISGYGSFKQLSKDEISTSLRGMKGEMQQISKLEDMAAGVPPLKTGIERRTPTEEERRLIKAVNESKVKFQVPITDPATQLKSALDTRKTQLENQIKDYEAKIRDGDYSKAPRRELTLDRRAQELLAQKNRIAKKWKEGVLRDRLANRKGLEKAFDWVTNIRRFEVLSGFRTMAKLAAYSATKVPTMLATEAVGRGLSKLPYLRQIAGKAPSESGATVGQSARAIAKGLTQGFSDAYKTLTTGESDLKAAFNTRPQEPRQWWQFYQILHEAIKSPLRRTAFELSLAKRVEHAALNGADVTDPLVRIALGTDAYIDSDRALLLENNRLSSAIRSGFKQLERPDKKTGRVPFAGKAAATVGRVQFPILTVPLNYAKQEIGSAFGLVSGSAKARLAFKEGIDKLDPKEADQILRHLKYGTIGGALLLYGFYDGWKHGANGTFGGYYLPGEKKKPTQAGIGGVRLGGHNISGLFLHNPLLAVGQLGHTIGAVAHSKFSKNDHDNKGITVGTVAGLMGIVNDSPLGQNATYLSQLGTPREIPYAVGEQLKGLVAPQMIQEIALYTDRDANGNLINRKPRTITEHVESGIPGLRQNVPVAGQNFNFNQ
jgi:hypothetical protein